MTKRPLIFITNDDGYQAKGIKSLTEAVSQIGDVLVVAPDGPRSGMSCAITSLEPIRHQLISKENGITVYSCSGTPVDCVKFGISQIADRKPDLIVSGINHGSNASVCVQYSGTMGAAIEGAILGIPSIGFSLLDHDANADFSHTYKYIKEIALNILQSGLPNGVCLNVNFPHSQVGVNGVKVCSQAEGKFVQEFKKATDGGERVIHWLTGYFENSEPNNELTDEWALDKGFASVVPTKVNMTDYDLLKDLQSLENIK